MISDFLQRLLFVREFEIGNGRTEIIGTKETLVPLSLLMRLQESNPESFYTNMAECIKGFFDRVEKDFGEETFTKAEDIYGVFGLGKLRIVDFNREEGKAFVEIHETPLIDDYPGHHHTCSITTGVLSGMFSSLLKKEVHSTVNKCMAKGDPHCEFIIK